MQEMQDHNSQSNNRLKLTIDALKQEKDALNARLIKANHYKLQDAIAKSNRKMQANAHNDGNDDLDD
eukprot:CAMPEP_0116871484 /NCGR_PEP_ID=MMETSP0463-20121206/1857_1 /TAXON_ID=181622 /ORGANISM="Strombidinopsis sp, Strain SopsisLIS2011" /LENGTH=66 /DNA_ID=CAMNT_0004509997 /DNA_START=336 /DNA_END=536 /DNA_ORIENTATION=+